MLTPRLVGTRYVVPLREGGSLPAVVEADDGQAYVAKFRGAGQGPKALVAEAIAASLARALDLPVPAPAILTLEGGFGAAEPDPEIQDLLRASSGENFGLAYLSGALAFDPAADGPTLSPDLAADVVWFDAYITNVDRTARNTNLLWWRDRLWLIDHGASLYFHHRWEGWQARVGAPFPQVADHVLLPYAGDLLAADARLGQRLDEATINAVVADIPAAWLSDELLFPSLDAHREAYVTYLLRRLEEPRAWLQTAIAAQQQGQRALAPRATHQVGPRPGLTTDN